MPQSPADREVETVQFDSKWLRGSPMWFRCSPPAHDQLGLTKVALTVETHAG
jgi:hypothetical protein